MKKNNPYKKGSIIAEYWNDGYKEATSDCNELIEKMAKVLKSVSYKFQEHNKETGYLKGLEDGYINEMNEITNVLFLYIRHKDNNLVTA